MHYNIDSIENKWNIINYMIDYICQLKMIEFLFNIIISIFKINGQLICTI